MGSVLKAQMRPKLLQSADYMSAYYRVVFAEDDSAVFVISIQDVFRSTRLQSEGSKPVACGKAIFAASRTQPTKCRLACHILEVVKKIGTYG